jgi:peptidoglycan hydrolase CwlO-like protein
MKRISGRLALGVLAAAMLVPAQAPAAAVAADPAQQLAQLNQQLTDSQARLDKLNNSVEVAESDAVNLNARLADDQKREAELQRQVAVLARTQYERPALSLTTILDATSLDQLLSDIAQSQLIAQKQWRLKIQAQQLRTKDQQTRDQQAANTEKIKQSRDEAAQVAARTLSLRNNANDTVIKARADAVAAQARATQAAATRPTAAAKPPPPPPAPAQGGPPPPGAIVEPPGSNHFAYGYCTWYVANRRNVPWFGDAAQWWPNAPPYGYAEGQTPVVGAIMVTRESGWGHVAYVESVNGDGSWTVSEMNFAGWNVVSRRTLRPGQAPVLGFIYGKR